MPADFKDKVVLITGGNAGIGRATAVKFALAGAKVAIAARRAAANQETLGAIKQAGGEGLALVADVAKEGDLRRMVEETVRAFGRLDFAFNNAGIEEEPGTWHGDTAGLYQKIFDINVRGVLLAAKYEAEAMLKTGGGCIVNTSSIAGKIGMAGIPIYVASKHAVEGLTKSLALEYGRQGVRINAVSPAAIETDMYKRFVDGRAGMREALANMHPIGRIGQPDEIADIVLWLCSEESSFVLGQSITADGGFTIQ
jgi:NAD(P)-dependent dehydrogenase (short-subunit alcohol dehydrogenase family)